MVYRDSTKEAERQQSLISTDGIGVWLMENGNRISWRDYGYNNQTGAIWDPTGSLSKQSGKILTGMVGERREVSARENISRRNSSIQFRRNRPVLQSNYFEKLGKFRR